MAGSSAWRGTVGSAKENAPTEPCTFAQGSSEIALAARKSTTLAPGEDARAHVEDRDLGREPGQPLSSNRGLLTRTDVDRWEANRWTLKTAASLLMFRPFSLLSRVVSPSLKFSAEVFEHLSSLIP